MQKLNIWLYDNHLTDDPNDYFGKVKPSGRISNADIAKLIIDNGCEIKEETIVDILSRSDKMKASYLAQGYSLNTPLLHGRLTVSGSFKGSTAIFDQHTHRLAASFSQGSALRKAIDKASVDILGVAASGPIIGKVLDSLSGEENSVITPSNAIKISGSKIKIEGDKPEVGLWFINHADQTRIQATQLINNDPKSIIAMVPDLVKGEYSLEAVTQYCNGATFLKNVRTALFEHILTVE